MAPKPGAIGRGDLLRTLHRLHQNGAEPIDNAMAEAFGFDRRKRVDGEPSATTATRGPRKADPLPRNLELGEALTEFGIWVCNACTKQVVMEVSTESRPVTPESTRQKQSSPTVHPVHRAAQLLNLWDNTLVDKRYSHRLDVPRIVRTLSEAKPILSLPRLTRNAFTTDLVLMLDLRDRLRPLWRDELALYANLDQLLGEQCRLVAIRDDPETMLRRALQGSDDLEAVLSDETRIVVLSDFDVIKSARPIDTDRITAWKDWLQILVERGNQVITLGIEGSAPNPLVSHRGLLGAEQDDAHVDALIGAMSRGHLCTVERLRFLHDALRDADTPALATEIAVWNHADRKSTNTAQWSIKSNRRDYWLDRYCDLSTDDCDRLDHATSRWRASLYADQAGLEAMIDRDAGLGDGPDDGAFLKALQIGSSGTEGKNRLDSWLFSAHDLLCDVAITYKDEPELQPLLIEVQQHAHRFGLRQPMGLMHIADAESSKLFFEQIGQDLVTSKEPGLATVWEGSSLILDNASQRVIQFGDRFTGDECTLQSSTHHVQLKRIYPPKWADSFFKDTSGQVFASHPDKVTFHLHPADVNHPQAIWEKSEGDWSWASQTGVDQYGLWAEFAVNEITQRLRWIPPGEFLMGSPEDEPKREDNERLHRVTLTQGYWLADTASTQALWEAVMGSNPSRFNGSDRPVESVSWGEVTRFIDQLNDKLPGLQGRLPTEAEWEYAARAGNQSPFWWGSTLSAEQANYDGNYPYADGEKGTCREETVPVKEFEPNSWGLYQVHGNVWEWCEDWYGEYEQEAVVNPRGAESGVGRVCRGGSWNGGGGRLRAAFRVRDGPANRDGFLGFRLSAGQSGAEPQ